MDGDEEAVGRRVRDSVARIARDAYEAAHGGVASTEARGIRWRLDGRVAASLSIVLALVVALVWLALRPAGAPPSVAVVAHVSSPPLVIDVAGAVVSPAVVDLPAGSRVRDAVAAAGGLAPDADPSSVNLARRLADGEQVYIPVEGEGASGTVNLNRADAGELEELPGIGPVLAGRIVADRARNGPFASVDDLARVPGIGASVLGGLAGIATV